MKLSESFKKLFVSMVDHNPSKRPSLDQLLEFEWFQGSSMSVDEFREYMRAKELGFQ